MAFRSILVIVDDAPSAGGRIDVAVALAADHDAHLTGLYVRPPLSLPASLETYFTDEMRDAYLEEREARVALAALGFEERVRRAGRREHADWRLASGDPSDVAAGHGRCCDLVVVGQSDPDVADEAALVHPERLIFECGRPVLAVPYVGRFHHVGRRVLVGWNGSREAARAVGDALALLGRAQSVTLLSLGAEFGEPAAAGAEAGGGLARHLARHRVAAEAAHFVCEPHEVGDTLLNTTSDLGGDLIVMGAYGRSRLRALVLGSLTGFMLKHMTVPVLFSH